MLNKYNVGTPSMKNGNIGICFEIENYGKIGKKQFDVQS